MPDERIVVVGSGVTGLACAAGFAGLGYPVTLCGDEPPVFDASADYDLRVFALNDTSCALLESLGAWDAIAARRLCRYEAMEVWCGRERLGFHATDVARDRLGVIVENRLLRGTLFEHLRARRQVDIRCPARFVSMRLAAGGWRVALDDDSEVGATLVIGADGAGSRVRAGAGIEYRRRSYREKALVATVKCEVAHGGICLQRFSGEGITAFLPLARDDLGSVVWSCPGPLAGELSTLPDDAFGERLTQVFERRLGAMVPASGRGAFPLHGALADDYVVTRGDAGVALVGDAAHSVHPLAGQGANMGLADVSALLAAAATGVGQSALRRYQRGVKGRNLGMKYALDAIRWWFVDARAPARMLPVSGLSLVDRCLPLKAWFIGQAS